MGREETDRGGGGKRERNRIERGGMREEEKGGCMRVV